MIFNIFYKSMGPLCTKLPGHEVKVYIAKNIKSAPHAFIFSHIKP